MATGRRGAASGSRSKPPTSTATKPLLRPDPPSVPYAELHCHSNFSFLDGASHPEQLAEEAARLGLEALALTDQNGLYGVVRFAEAARAVGLPTVFGAEITLGASTSRQVLSEDDTQQQIAPAWSRAMARSAWRARGACSPTGPTGYARLARGRSASGNWPARRVRHSSCSTSPRRSAGHGWVLTGCRHGVVPAALVAMGRGSGHAVAAADQLFGRDRVVVELWDHGDPLDSARNDALAELAARHDVVCIATNDVHYATPPQRRWPRRSLRCGRGEVSTR